jgi:hypothetical protein
MGGDDDLVDIDLSDEEWNLLYKGVLELGGPTALDDVISRAIGYRDAAELHEHWSTLLHAVKERRALSPRDWRRAQIATEVTFASGYYGAASDWEVCSMLDDATSIRLLRQVQRKLITTVGRAERAPRGK